MDSPVIGLRPEAPSRMAKQVALLPAGLSFVALATGAILALWAADDQVYGGFFLGILVLGCVAWVARKADLSVMRGLLLLYVLALAAWALTKVSHQVSDFGVYLRCGAPLWQKADSFQQWMQQCQSAWLPGNPAFWRRALLYTLPIGMLGGDEYLTLKLVNAGLHLAAVIALYHVVAHWTSRQQGILAAAALAIFPEYWFTTSLATSDNLVIPLLIVWLGLVTSSTSDRMSVWKIVAAAIIGVSLDLLRDIGLICVLATLILAVLTPGRSRWKLLFLSALTFFLMVFASSLGTHFSLAPADNSGLLARLTGHGITSTSAWAENYRWNQYVYPLLDPQSRNRYFAGLLATDLQHGVAAAFENWAAKVQVLFQGDGYYYFSSAPLGGNPDDFPIVNAASAIPPSNDVRFVLKGFTAGIALLALVGGARARSQALGKVGIVFSCAFLFLVIGFGEIQPRYAALLAPALSIMISGLLAPRLQRTAGAVADVCMSITLFAVAVAIALSALPPVLSRYFASAPALSGFRQEDPNSIDNVQCNTRKAQVRIEERFAQIQFPNPGQSCYSFLLETNGDQRPLTFHVIRDPVLPLWQTPPYAPVTVDVSMPGAPGAPIVADLNLRMNAAQRATIPAIPGGTRLRVTILVGGELDPSMQGVAIGFFHDESGRPARLFSTSGPAAP